MATVGEVDIDALGWLQVLILVIALALIWSSNRYLIRAIRQNREYGHKVLRATELGFTGIFGGIALLGMTLADFVGRVCG